MIYTVFKVDGSALFQSARIDGADFLNFDTRKGRDIHPPYFCGSRHLCQNVLPMCFRVAPSMQGFLSPKFPSLRNIHPVGCARFFLFPLVSECPWLHNFQMSSNTVLVGIVIWISNSVFLHLKFFIHFWAIYSCIFMSWLGLQLLPQECGTYSRGALEDFLGIPPFQLCFEVTCSHFWGVAPSILAFLGLGLQVSPRECAVYSCGVLVDFSANPAISAICCLTCNPFWGLRQCIKVTCSPFWGCAIYSCLFGVWLALHVLHSVLVDFLGVPPFQSAAFWGDLQPILGVAPSIPAFLCLGWVCSSCHRNVAPIPAVLWRIF